MTSRSARVARQNNRFVMLVLGLVLVAAALAIWYAEPHETDKPLVTVYADADCDCCQLWIKQLKSRGFRVELGSKERRSSVRASFALPEKMQACHTAIVEGLLIEGHVPAHDVRQVLERPNHAGIVGLIVPGMPRGSPGMESLVREPFTVYELRASGEIRPLFHHDEHEFH